MKTILCPVDFSANATNAVRYAVKLNEKLKAKIILLHTYETPVLYTDVAPFTMQMDYAALHDNAAKDLKAFHKKVFGADQVDNVEMVLQQGLPSSRIKDIALEKKVDMIIMGATGTGAAERLLVGSNALRVAKEAPCMVMLIPQKAKFDGLEKLVYATDLSSDNLMQVKEIFPLAKKFNSELLFLYIDQSTVRDDAEILKTVTAKIKKHVPYAKKSGFVCSDASVSDGVEYFLKKQKADCLVMYHRHRNLFQAMYSTSISKKLSLHVSLPVIFIHQDDFALHD